MIPCSAEGCNRGAVSWLEFRGMPGHVHVCAEDEQIDREWADVTASGPLSEAHPCSAILFHAVPTELP